jgi:hypothetical protein
MRQINRDGTRGFDTSISDRRRGYPHDLPFVDLDFVGIGYASHEPCFLVENKGKGNYKPLDPSQRASIDAVLRLGTKAGLPAFVVEFWPSEEGLWTIRFCEYNEIGMKALIAFFGAEWFETSCNRCEAGEAEGITVDEEQWVRFEYFLRGLDSRQDKESCIRAWKRIVGLNAPEPTVPVPDWMGEEDID